MRPRIYSLTRQFYYYFVLFEQKNMVGPGDVDDDLEGETKEECQKYGEVNKCVIFEVSNKKKKHLKMFCKSNGNFSID